MARRISRGRGFIRPAPKTKIWAGNNLSLITLATSAKTLVAEMSAGFLALRPFTILRTRTVITFRTDQLTGSESPTGALGMIIVKEIAVNIGVTATPGPRTDPDSDWFVYQGMTAPFLFSDATGWGDSGTMQYVVDSKAMRKVGPDDDIATIVELDAAGGAFLNCEGRILIQLH